jgi:hypothetical protein
VPAWRHAGVRVRRDASMRRELRVGRVHVSSGHARVWNRHHVRGGRRRSQLRQVRERLHCPPPCERPNVVHGLGVRISGELVRGGLGRLQRRSHRWLRGQPQRRRALRRVHDGLSPRRARVHTVGRDVLVRDRLHRRSGDDPLRGDLVVRQRDGRSGQLRIVRTRVRDRRDVYELAVQLPGPGNADVRQLRNAGADVHGRRVVDVVHVLRRRAVRAHERPVV